MQDEQNDQVNDESDTNCQPEQVQIPTEQDEQKDIQKRKKVWKGFTGIAAYQLLKQKMTDIINGGK